MAAPPIAINSYELSGGPGRLGAGGPSGVASALHRVVSFADLLRACLQTRCRDRYLKLAIEARYRASHEFFAGKALERNCPIIVAARDAV